MINQSTNQADAVVATPPVGTLLLAVVAPFGVIALMASPLLIDALRTALGV
jgi:hypothetical protein